MTRSQHAPEHAPISANEIELAQTVLALANTHGGSFLVEHAPEADEIERLVAELAAPPVLGIRCVPRGTLVEIVVPESERKPHVVERDPVVAGSHEIDSFAEGLILVRRGERNVPATADDLEQMIRERVADLLSELSGTVRKPGFPLRLTDDAGIAVHLSTDAGALEVTADMNRAYPYTATALGLLFGKSTNWAAAAIAVLGLKGDPDTWLGIKNLRGDVSVEKYSERAVEHLRERLAREPDWNPYAEWRRVRESGR